MTKNNAFIIEKFETFSDLLKKNNTEALVEVMKSVTESFNSQMNELIERLVKENFEELNHSVQSMNTWQQENKQIIIELTSNYRNLTNSFETTANTLSNVKDNVAELVGENSKLIELVDVMNQVLIEDNNFTAISTKLANTVDKIEENTQAFTETTNKLNDWVRTERDFKESADRLIVQLEQFKDFNSGVWVNYRKEMEAAVAIIEKTSQTISTNLENHNDHFYDSLASTFENLDTLIQRTIKKYE